MGESSPSPEAVEKAIKACLVVHGVDFPRTHDLDFLLARAEGHGVTVPKEIEDAEWLSPWAAQLRYDEEETRLDREAATVAAACAVDSARALVGDRPAD